jgi:hypothetical protein
MITIVRGSGNNRKSAVLPAWQARSSREERERVVEDTKALVTRPATFHNFSGRL